MSPGVDAPVDAEVERTLTEYLAAHPDFFERHHELLATLRLPHGPGQTVSLVERQLGLLRTQSDQLRARLEGLIAVARENELLHDRLHRLTLALLDAGDFDAVLETLRTELQAHFQADAVALRRVAAEDLQRPQGQSPQTGALLLRELIATGRPRCGALGEEELAYFFGAEAGDSRSVALIPLIGSRLTGALAIGSRDPQRFHPGKATDFLVRLGEVVARAVQAVAPREAQVG
jgi:uncharacterized protein YigA (DUF484 family)